MNNIFYPTTATLCRYRYVSVDEKHRINTEYLNARKGNLHQQNGHLVGAEAALALM